MSEDKNNPSPKDAVLASPKSELSIESASKIVASIVSEPLDSILARARSYGDFITPLERRAFERVALNIAKRKDRTESLAAEKQNEGERLTLRVGLDRLLPMDISLTHSKIGERVDEQFNLPLSERLIAGGFMEVEYFTTNSSLSVQFADTLDKEKMARIVMATKWLAENLMGWNKAEIIKPNLS